LRRVAAAAVLAGALAGAAGAAPPEDWIGHWTGTCRLAPPHEGLESFPASLTVAPGSTAGALRWRLSYETGQRDVRDYELVPVDAAKGHYAIDEKNGLLLDAVLSDGVLYAPFAIADRMIVATYFVGPDGAMIANMPAFAREPARTTCLTGAPETCAASFMLVQTQHCRLTRAAMSKF